MEILAMQAGQHLPAPWENRARTLRVLRHIVKGTLRNRACNLLTLMAGETGAPSAGGREPQGRIGWPSPDCQRRGGPGPPPCATTSLLSGIRLWTWDGSPEPSSIWPRRPDSRVWRPVPRQSPRPTANSVQQLLNRVVPALREGITPQDSVRTFQDADEGPLLPDGLDAVLRARGDEAAGRRQQGTHEALVASDEEDE